MKCRGSTGQRAAKSAWWSQVNSETNDYDLCHIQVIKMERQGTNEIFPKVSKIFKQIFSYIQ